VSSNCHSKRSNFSVSSSMHGQVSSLRSPSDRASGARVDDVHHGRSLVSPMFDPGYESSHKPRESWRNEVRQAAKDFGRKACWLDGRDYGQRGGRWYDQGFWIV
jgi:hypothetical protein